MSETDTKPEAGATPPAAAPDTPAATPASGAAGPAPTGSAAPAAEARPDDLLAAPAVPAEPVPPAAEATKPPDLAPPAYGDAPALPEGITVTAPDAFARRLGTFDAKLGSLEQQFGVSHEAAAAFRTEVLSMAFDEIAAITRRAADSAASATTEARRQLDAERATQGQTWRQEFEDDPSLAGNHRETTLWRANAVIDEYAADRTLAPAERKAQTEAFKTALRESGLQNHPAMVRLLRNVGNDLVEGTPVPALKASPPPRSKAQKRYR
jgi:hypothetical protein